MKKLIVLTALAICSASGCTTPLLIRTDYLPPGYSATAQVPTGNKCTQIRLTRYPVDEKNWDGTLEYELLCSASMEDRGTIPVARVYRHKVRDGAKVPLYPFWLLTGIVTFGQVDLFKERTYNVKGMMDGSDLPGCVGWGLQPMEKRMLEFTVKGGGAEGMPEKKLKGEVDKSGKVSLDLKEYAKEGSTCAGGIEVTASTHWPNRESIPNAKPVTLVIPREYWMELRTGMEEKKL